MKHWALVLFFLLPAAHPAAEAAEAQRGPDGAQHAWMRIPGGPGTACSQGTPYAFFFRSGNPEKLLVHFEGGGACWMSSNCDVNQHPTYVPAIDLKQDPPPAGIFDFANPGNPFTDYSVLFVPYCTGDVHLGNKTVTYSTPASERRPGSTLRIHHNGYGNAAAALRWTYRRVKTPRQVFVSGESAGAIASAFYADRVADHYTHAQIVQLGDSAGGYRAAMVPRLLEGWGATELMRSFKSYVQADASKLNFERLYIAAAHNHPKTQLAQFNTAEDETQLVFLNLIGVPNAVLPQLLEQNLADIRAVAPGFRSYTSPGKVHVILRRPEFYSTQVNGTRLSDWVAALAAGRAVDNVSLTSGK